VSSVFSVGEIEVQTKAGVREMAKRVGNGIKHTLDADGQAFLAEQTILILGHTDRSGSVWASILYGSPGFITVIDNQNISVRALPGNGDPLAMSLASSMEHQETPLKIGTLAIDLETRDRLRLNGMGRLSDARELLIHLQEVYYNCPKYIQSREITLDSPDHTNASVANKPSHSAELSQSQRHWIEKADTFFIASSSESGADASHRGGNPGFVRALDSKTILFPDYSGNMMFNTLGNLTTNPNAGLLFLDFDRGSTLQLTGTTTILWDRDSVEPFVGAERVVRFELRQAVEVDESLPLHFRFIQYSRFNPIQRQ